MSLVPKDTVVIDKEEYDELKKDQKLLYALQGAGVDNWEGWDIALESLEEGA